jgi:Protein kinase domain
MLVLNRRGKVVRWHVFFPIKKGCAYNWMLTRLYITVAVFFFFFRLRDLKKNSCIFFFASYFFNIQPVMAEQIISATKPKKRRGTKKRTKRKGRKRDFITLSQKQDDGIWLLKGKSGVIADDYDVLELLGQGAFAKVFRGTHKKTGEEVAIKIIDKANVGNEVSSLVAEVGILKQVQHQYVIQLKDLYETKTYVSFFLKRAWRRKKRKKMCVFFY